MPAGRFRVTPVPSGLKLNSTVRAYASLDPRAPFTPFVPLVPFVPLAPEGPRGPAGSWPARKSRASSERFFTFDDVTAFFFSCFVPTLFFGSFRHVQGPGRRGRDSNPRESF